MYEIKKTDDYSIFKKMNLNRDISEAHLKNLEKIILKNNYLALHPILCNNYMQVIDGQHRLLIAKKNNLEVYYIKSDVSDYHILDTNLYQKKLSIKEVINFYAIKEKKEDYIALITHISLLNITIRSILALLFGIASTSLLKVIKKGTFVMPPISSSFEKISSHYLEFIKFVESRRIKPYSMFKNFNFCIAFRNLILNESFDFSCFIKKLENKWFQLKPQIDSHAWSELLLNIYNWKNHEPI